MVSVGCFFCVAWFVALKCPLQPMLLRNISLEDLRFMRYLLDSCQLTRGFIIYLPPSSKVLGQLGMWGLLINGIQAALLEHVDMSAASWNRVTGGPYLPQQLTISLRL